MIDCSVMFRSFFLRFDYRGIGESTGDLHSLTSTDWLNDALTVLDTLTGPGEPQVLVGSSMGALLMLHVALRRPEKVFGVVGIALPINYIATISNLLTDEVRWLITTSFTKGSPHFFPIITSVIQNPSKTHPHFLSNYYISHLVLLGNLLLIDGFR